MFRFQDIKNDLGQGKNRNARNQKFHYQKIIIVHLKILDGRSTKGFMDFRKNADAVHQFDLSLRIIYEFRNLNRTGRPASDSGSKMSIIVHDQRGFLSQEEDGLNIPLVSGSSNPQGPSPGILPLHGYPVFWHKP